MIRTVLLLIAMLAVSFVVGFFTHWSLGALTLLLLSNFIRLFLIKRLESIRVNTRFTTIEGKALIDDINQRINVLRLWKLLRKK